MDTLSPRMQRLATHAHVCHLSVLQGGSSQLKKKAHHVKSVLRRTDYYGLVVHLMGCVYFQNAHKNKSGERKPNNKAYYSIVLAKQRLRFFIVTCRRGTTSYYYCTSKTRPYYSLISNNYTSTHPPIHPYVIIHQSLVAVSK